MFNMSSLMSFCVVCVIMLQTPKPQHNDTNNETLNDTPNDTSLKNFLMVVCVGVVSFIFHLRNLRNLRRLLFHVSFLYLSLWVVVCVLFANPPTTQTTQTHHHHKHLKELSLGTFLWGVVSLCRRLFASLALYMSLFV